MSVSGSLKTESELVDAIETLLEGRTVASVTAILATVMVDVAQLTELEQERGGAYVLNALVYTLHKFRLELYPDVEATPNPDDPNQPRKPSDFLN